MPNRDHTRHRTIHVIWSSGKSCSGLTLYDKTVAEARSTAGYFGYKTPRWYFPWEYLTHRLVIDVVEP